MKTITKALAALLVLASFVMLTGCNKPRSEKKILSFKFYEPAVEATVMESAKTVIATVPEGTNVTAMVPIIIVSDNATVYPASGIPQNFTSPKTYIVTAEDGTQAVYTVTVTIGSGGGNGGSVNPQTYTITTSANPADGGTVTGGGTYTSGTSVTLRATANTNYAFDHWQDGSTANPRTIIVAANTTYTAYFTYNGGGGGNGSANGHEYVDLGLPSGTLWATCNVGASSPEGYGDYFAWGEIHPKDYYDWTTYLYCIGTEYNLTKYCNDSSCGYNGFTDNLTSLQLSDDAARANWGAHWRMPTLEEWQELYQNTTGIWTTQNGVYGRLLTAANGKCLFLPAAGDRYLSSLDYAGSDGNYWSTLLSDLDTAWAYGFCFSSRVHCDGVISDIARQAGQSIRPVLSSR